MGWLMVIYGLLLVGVGRWVSARWGSDLGVFYNARRRGNWVWVAFSMVGTATSGLTFLSLPGSVRQDGWTYLQVLAGYLVGYTLVAYVLLPGYYRLSQASIYEYFRHKLGTGAEQVAAAIFLISRLVASSVRLYLALMVLQIFFPEVPFALLSFLGLCLIFAYAEQGGTGAIIHTDILQTIALLGAAFFTLLYIASQNIWSAFKIPVIIETSVESRHFFWKDFTGGVLLAFTMTGLDQDQMQKSLSMPGLRQAQRMLLLYAALLVPVKLLFLTLGSALWAYVEVTSFSVPPQSDQLYAWLAKTAFPFWIGALFVTGLVSATLSSVDGALIAMTTVTLRNLLWPWQESIILKRVIFVFWIVMSWGVTLYFYYFPPQRYALDTFLKLGSYTYGPLLGLFLFSLWARGLRPAYRHSGWVVPLSFGIAIGLERLLKIDWGYGVIVWVAGWTLLGLLMVSRVR